MIEKFYKGNQDKILVTHGKCSDGFGAAWSIWNKYGDDLEYIFATHKDIPIEVKGKKILFTDFAYERKVMEKLSADNDVFVIDHHIFAFEDLKGLKNTFFDLTKSGSVLAWENTFPDKKVPLILKYVEDRDLVKYEMPYSMEILSVLDTIPKDFESWNYFSKELENNFQEVLNEGIIIREKFELKLESLTKNPIIININGKKGVAVNAEEWDYASYAAEKLSKISDFGMSWYKDEKGNIKCSFRSCNGLDVNELAKTIGGGGHANSAGATIDNKKLNEILISGKKNKIIHKI